MRFNILFLTFLVLAFFALVFGGETLWICTIIVAVLWLISEWIIRGQ